mmetsp:Transcript_21236/g.55344  ORF Transcript_21236/g.55344 Transcript_21236/m.55344 type:complete len:148 (-) Transcript_21236:830-1273(-)
MSCNLGMYGLLHLGHVWEDLSLTLSGVGMSCSDAKQQLVRRIGMRACMCKEVQQQGHSVLVVGMSSQATWTVSAYVYNTGVSCTFFSFFGREYLHEGRRTKHESCHAAQQQRVAKLRLRGQTSTFKLPEGRLAGWNAYPWEEEVGIH